VGSFKKQINKGIEMSILQQTIVVSQDEQRFGAVDWLRKLIEAIECSDMSVEIESVDLTLRAEHDEDMTEIVVSDPHV